MDFEGCVFPNEENGKKRLPNKYNIVVLYGNMPDHFTAAAARRIVGISQRCLDYWDERGVVSPAVKRATGKGSERRYSYEDLLKLSVVKRLRDAGLSLQRIRKGLSQLRKRRGSADPLLEEILVTDGRSLHRLTQDRLVVEDLLSSGQLAFSVVAVGRINEDLRGRVVRLRDAIPHRGKPSKLRIRAAQ
jgi:DNA-binding transcriptional MerR regulator